MDNEVKYLCKCGTELPPNHTGPCPKCGRIGEVHRVLDLAVSDGFVTHESINIRQKRKGFGKFMIESVQGWFPSGDPKLKKGVDIVRIIDREKKEKHHIVTDLATGKVIHEEHEPLSQHKSQVKHLPKNAKKPKQNKEQRGVK